LKSGIHNVTGFHFVAVADGGLCGFTTAKEKKERNVFYHA
jgi:hypothetical protein